MTYLWKWWCSIAMSNYQRVSPWDVDQIYRRCCALQAHEKTRLWRHIESVITDMDPSQLKVQSLGIPVAWWGARGSGHMFCCREKHLWPICPLYDSSSVGMPRVWYFFHCWQFSHLSHFYGCASACWQWPKTKRNKNCMGTTRAEGSTSVLGDWKQTHVCEKPSVVDNKIPSTTKGLKYPDPRGFRHGVYRGQYSYFRPLTFCVI